MINKLEVYDKYTKETYEVESINWDCFGEIKCVSVFINPFECKNYVRNHCCEEHRIEALEIIGVDTDE